MELLLGMRNVHMLTSACFLFDVPGYRNNMSNFKEGFITLNYVPTHVMTWGGWIDETDVISKKKELLLLFTGNPGVALFYSEFLQQLHDKLKMPVWVISHAGHELPSGLIPNLEKNQQLYDVEGQIMNKKEFLKRYVPRGCKIHLLGHSVGAYMALNLLKDDDFAEQVQASYLLFPVLENIAKTPNGRFLSKAVVHILWLVYFLAGIFAALPTFIQMTLISLYLRLFGTGTSTTVKQGVIQLINPKILRSVFFLAFDEMKVIKELDVELIKKRKEKLIIYYGDHDRWAPVSHYENLIKSVPNVQAMVCKKGLDHAFMLCKPSYLMAEVVEEMVQKNRTK
ncbi:Lipid droplet-associated hydrolase [Frankliniella fusca]|uniref:Lipid droplet-associated hydrolase n=1 Tax=Frankliniella fusca TaxID=407009 RepID=A0AAE1HVZ0_9NEOP|nr:Lipid droplet-associated hydrolase [Frankliniella fusca]